MKRMFMALAILMLSIIFLSNAEAGDRRTGGIILGGATGAMVGQAIGHNAESTIIGATVGGVAGLVIGNELQRQRGPGYHPAQLTVYTENYGNSRYERRPQPAFRDGYRHYRENCRKIVTIERYNHRTRRVITTICDNDQRHHYRNRFDNRF